MTIKFYLSESIASLFLAVLSMTAVRRKGPYQQQACSFPLLPKKSKLSFGWAGLHKKLTTATAEYTNFQPPVNYSSFFIDIYFYGWINYLMSSRNIVLLHTVPRTTLNSIIHAWSKGTPSSSAVLKRFIHSTFFPWKCSLPLVKSEIVLSICSF